MHIVPSIHFVLLEVLDLPDDPSYRHDSHARRLASAFECATAAEDITTTPPLPRRGGELRGRG